MYNLVNQLAQVGRRDNLRFFIERHIFDVEQLFQDLRAGCTRSDAAALDLSAQLFVLDKLTGIFHRQNHRTGGITLRRRRLALFNLQIIQ